ILPTYESNIRYEAIETYENRYLKNGKIRVIGEIEAQAGNREEVGLHEGKAIIEIDNGIEIEEGKIKIEYYEGATGQTSQIGEYTREGNIIRVGYGKGGNGESRKGDKIKITVEGKAKKLGGYTSSIRGEGYLKDYRGTKTGINLGEVTRASKNINIEYQMPKGIIKIKKKDSITEEKIENAEFKIYEWNGREYEEKETIRDENGDGIYESREYEWNVISEGRYKIVESVVPENHKDLNFRMEYIINKLKEETYEIKPEYGNGEYRIEYSPREPDDFDRIDGEVENEPWKVKAEIEKIDEETKEQIKEEAEFSIYEWDKEEGRYKEYISYTRGQKVEMKRRADGRYETEEWMYYTKRNEGKYRIIETRAPYGYYGDYKNQEESEEKKEISSNEVILTGYICKKPIYRQT
ncbi:SpaA isopeptide-forming pilin-related protein, partial [Romboutsia ilealis]|uniref:SpaA isopeptide-forming pilin-related protein n=1 Tax=Romboutsia ilealis TaxID=1115758 RepID=UPI003AB9490F